MKFLVQMLKSLVLKVYWFFYDEIKYFFQRLKLFFNQSFKLFLSELTIYDSDITIAKIIQERQSVSRFGDGEFYVLWGGGNGFQNPNEKLQKRLKEVLGSSLDNLLVCIPSSWKDKSNLTHEAKMFYTKFLSTYYTKIVETLPSEKVFYDALFTRFYIDKKNKDNCKKQVEKIKSIWSNRRIFVIEGEYTRMGVGNDLFYKAAEVKRIICPSKNAFEKYDEILKTASDIIPKDYVVLIALGMTATILAYDLAKLGYQAIDIGHLDVEYEWMKLGTKKKIALVNRFVNEANNINSVQREKDNTYLMQIVKKIE